MISNHYHKPGIRWKINIINVAAMVVLLTMVVFIGQCVDNGVINNANNDGGITDNS